MSGLLYFDRKALREQRDCPVCTIIDKRVAELLRRIHPHSRRLHPDVECASRRVLTEEEDRA